MFDAWSAVQLLGNKDFNVLLELTPIVRDAIVAFQSSQYSRCLFILSQLAPTLALGRWLHAVGCAVRVGRSATCVRCLALYARADVHFSRHVDEVMKRIRARGMLQYFTPYSCVDLVKMAEAFNCSYVGWCCRRCVCYRVVIPLAGFLLRPVLSSSLVKSLNW